MNKKNETGRPELFPIPIKSPWYHLGMDFVGPITPPSSAGDRYILTISDYFTRFGWAKEFPTKEAKEVVAALKEVSINVLLGGKMIYSHSLYLALLSDGNSVCDNNRSGIRVSE